MSRQVIKVQMTPPITSDYSDPFHLQLHCHYSATETEKKNKFLELHGTASLKVHAVIKVLESVKAAIVLEWPFLFVSLQLAGRRGAQGSWAQGKRRNLDVKSPPPFGLLQMVLSRLLSTPKVIGNKTKITTD